MILLWNFHLKSVFSLMMHAKGNLQQEQFYRKLNVILSHFIIEFSYSNTESEYCHNENERNQSQIRDKVHLTKLKQKSSSS